MFRICCAALLGLIAAGAIGADSGAETDASAWGGTAEGRVRLIAAQDATGAGGEVTLGLQIRLAPGWKTYWRTPGDAGIPPSFDWSGSDNLAGATVRWPAPERFRVYGLETFGYVEEVVFPVQVRLRQPGAAAAIRLDLVYAVCADVCIPQEAKLALDLPAGPLRATPFAPLIARYAAMVPVVGSGAIEIESVIASGAGGGPLEVVATARQPFRAPRLIVEGPAGYWFTRPAVEISADGRRGVFRMQVEGGAPDQLLAGRSLTLTLIDGLVAVERRVVAGAGS